MNIHFNRILRKPRKPLALFLALIPLFCLIACVSAYFIIALNQSPNHPDYVLVKTENFEFESPKNWFALRWEDKNITYGNTYYAILSSLDVYIIMYLRLSDQKATQTFINENNLTDTLSIIQYEANRMYGWSRQAYTNATMRFTGNGTITVADREALYAQISIINGIKEDDSLYNMTGTIISYFTEQELVEVMLWGKEQDWIRAQSTYQIILNSIKI